MNLTPSQTILYNILQDGMPHHKSELLAALDPEGMMENSTFHWHLSKLREKIRPGGHDIICQLIHRQHKYRIVRTISHVD